MKNSLKGHDVKAPMITLDNTQLRAHVLDLVRQSVEDTLNALLDAEADLVISDKSLWLIEALGDFFPKAKWQRRVVHFYRNILSATPKGKAKAVALMIKSIHAKEDREATRKKAQEVAANKRDAKNI